MTKARQWPGLISNADPHDLPPGGATVQENFASRVPGRLTGRKGIRPVMFENADSAISKPTDEVLAIDSMSLLVGPTIVMLLADGTVRYGRRPM